MKYGSTISHLSRALTGTAGVFGRLAARPARLLLSTTHVQQKAYAQIALASLLVLVSSVARPATPPNTAISNIATANYTVSATPLTSNGSVTVNTASCTAVSVQIELLQYNPAGNAVMVQPGTYSNDGLPTGTFNALADPTLLGSATPTTLPANLTLSPLSNPGSAYSPTEPLFVRVTSYDSNTTAAPDTVLVTLTTSNGDSMLVRLTETGNSTGEFVGAIPSSASSAAVTINDGIIAVSPNETITAVYDHTNCSGTMIANTSTALMDPYGIVFNSATGAAVDGATVSLTDPSNNPVTVYCDDGTTVLTQPVTSGSPTNCDATMIAGGFRFPQVAAGNYKLAITPPVGNVYPSTVPAASLPASIGTPASTPVILGNPGTGGSYNGVFSLSGPAVKIDVPVDSGAMMLTIQKTSDFTTAGIGEFVPYTLSITNNTATPFPGAQIADYLPAGFQYQKGSARLNGTTMPSASPLRPPQRYAMSSK